ncbi:MAG: hypothetical protein NTW21_11280 [Verrucomicrobia bacterium]|nr:hypothetical protein [Verrucomicrobiota bacterium]
MKRHQRWKTDPYFTRDGPAWTDGASAAPPARREFRLHRRRTLAKVTAWVRLPGETSKTIPVTIIGDETADLGNNRMPFCQKTDDFLPKTP